MAAFGEWTPSAALLAPALPPAVVDQAFEPLDQVPRDGAMWRCGPLRQLAHLVGHEPLHGLPQGSRELLLPGSRPAVQLVDLGAVQPVHPKPDLRAGAGGVEALHGPTKLLPLHLGPVHREVCAGQVGGVRRLGACL